MKQSFRTVLMAAGLAVLPCLGAAAAVTCNIDDSAVVAAAQTATPTAGSAHPDLCQAIYWNAYQGCINNGQGAKSCPSLIGFMNNGSLSTITANCIMGGRSTAASCETELYYFDSTGGQQTVNGNAMYPQNCQAVTTEATAGTPPPQPPASGYGFTCS